MKFLTEEDLRLLYRKAPFDTYSPAPGMRLTPGGRQFLNDRGVKIREEGGGSGKRCGTESVRAERAAATEGKTVSGQRRDAGLAIRCIQAMFLQAGIDLLPESVLTAQELFNLERALAAAAGSAGDCHFIPEFSACGGISRENAGELLPDCFEVTGFHAQSERGREIVRLHRLRCALRQLEPDLEPGQREIVHRVINRLSQMICTAFGGKTCQRKE